MWPRSSTPRVTSMLRYMLSRSSRSRPASRTSWSDPTGPASLAIAIGGTLAIVPVVRLGDLSQPGLCLGVEHRRVVRRDRAANPRGDELWQWMLRERRDRAGAEVR